MAKQERIQKPRVVVDRNTRTEVMADSRTHREGDKLRAEFDDMLDEVDEILDENEEFRNAQAFVEGYVQKGGE
jgi:ubiquitin-like protein Pup